MDSSVWSAIISGIALVAAVISPVLTTIINNHFQNKVSHRRYYDEHRAEVIENYIRYAGMISRHSQSSEDFRGYGQYCKEVYLYLPESFWPLVDSAHNYITNSKFEEASAVLTQLCKQLNEYPPRSVKKKSNNKNT